MLDYPQVELDFMNHDHAEFVELREALLATLARKADPAKVDALLDRLLEHTRSHFAEENRLMQETGFPPYPMHKGEAEPAPDLDDLGIDAAESLYKEPLPVEYNPTLPIESFDFIITDDVSPVDLQSVARGVGVFRRVPDRTHRHAQQADLRLLQPPSSTSRPQ